MSDETHRITVIAPLSEPTMFGEHEMSDLTDRLDTQSLRHDHHGCRVCVRQRAEAADEIDKLRDAIWNEGDLWIEYTPREPSGFTVECHICHATQAIERHPSGTYASEQLIAAQEAVEHDDHCLWLAEHQRREALTDD